MMKISDILSVSLGVKDFQPGDIPADDVQKILQSALLSAYGNPSNTMELYATESRLQLEQLADSRESGAEAVGRASLAVVVVADKLYDGSWIENCSHAVWAMRAQALELGVACQVVQIRGYSLTDGTLSDDVVRGVMDIPDGKTVYALVAFGSAEIKPSAVDAEELDWSKVHI